MKLRSFALPLMLSLLAAIEVPGCKQHIVDCEKSTGTKAPTNSEGKYICLPPDVLACVLHKSGYNDCDDLPNSHDAEACRQALCLVPVRSNFTNLTPEQTEFLRQMGFYIPPESSGAGTRSSASD
jgi:hypothetical protein